MPINQTAVHSVYGEQTTAASPETVVLSVDGIPAAGIAVPAATRLVISDAIYHATAPGLFTLEVDRGAGFKAIANLGFNSPGLSEAMTLNTGIVVEGGPGVVFRVQVTTLIGTSVNITLRSYTEN